MKRIAILATAGVFATACTITDPNTGHQSRSNTRTGIIVGALLGAAAGCATNTNSGEQCRKNALIGAGVGALAGAGVGAYMDRQQRELEQQLSETGVGIRRDGDNIFLVMPADATFDVNSAQVDAAFFPVLTDVSETLNKYPKTLIDVEGHADSTGEASYNQRLSEQRATNVANFLVNQGVLAERLYVVGRGETSPIASNETVAGRERNRRVEIRIAPLT